MLSMILAFGTLATARSTPTWQVDRTGEPLLRKVLTWTMSQRKLSGLIIRSLRESGRSDAYPDGLIEYCFDGDRFRIEFGDMWGTTTRLISDGRKLLDDPGADPLVLRNLGKTLVECSPQLDYKGSIASPLFYFREGPKLLDRLDKDKSISLADETTLVWDSSLFGKLTIKTESVKEGYRPIEFRYNNMGWQIEMATQAPEWFEAADPSMEWKQVLVFTNDRRRQNWFSTKPPRGRTVQDLTQTKPAVSYNSIRWGL